MTGPWKGSGTGRCRRSLCSSIPRDGLAQRMPSSCTTGFSSSSGSTCVPKRSDIKKVLVIGSGPIIIGQAAEFDYSGTQACRALSEEGVEVVLVNSNPATIMTDVEVAERVYVEPLTPEFVTAVIARERPDGLLATLGGQTGLNLALALAQGGVLDRYGVPLLGTPLPAIQDAEDRERFRTTMMRLGHPVLQSRSAQTVDDALAAAATLGYPVVVRPGFTLGGTGGGIAADPRALAAVAAQGLLASPIGQVLVERSVQGWKEIEYEVIRDGAGTVITVCNMENVDPMGVHTGDSIVVAPSQTLSDADYQRLRTAALHIIDGLGIAGGCNIQFALDPASDAYFVIEVNPRVSRSSALASKATGYPIARVAAKIAIGLRLDEIPNRITGLTKAAFEPALDYVVVKIPRWPFDKFPTSDRRLGTQMKATGEVMAIGRSFPEALLKAVRSLDLRVGGLRLDDAAGWTEAGLVPAYKIVDTCAGEFPAATPYYYSTYETEDERPESHRPRIVVLGAGPIRIGQGIEFDYSTVHAVKALREAGYEAVIINNNPETVSTDFDISDRLYFEPLTVEDVLHVVRREEPDGVLVQFGGQTALNLAGPLRDAGVRILGTSVRSLDISEDREKFSLLLTALGIERPEGGGVWSLPACEALLHRIGLPVVVRPSYVLGGQGMEIADTAERVRVFVADALARDPAHPVLIDRYVEGLEVEVDAISDGTSVLIPGIMEHVERAGVHSGDSIALFPAQHLSEGVAAAIVVSTVRLARALKVQGFLNIQFVYDGTRLYVLEANLRASRTVPFVSKAVGMPLVQVATRVMLGDTLADFGFSDVHQLPAPSRVAVKAPVFSMEKLPRAEAAVGPEMRSTGEVMGLGADAATALHRALVAAGWHSRERSILVSLADRHKEQALPLLREMTAAGFRLLATPNTAAALHRAGIPAEAVTFDQAAELPVGLVLNTPTRGADPSRRGFQLRRSALARRIPCVTSLDTAAAVLAALIRAGEHPPVVSPLAPSALP